MAGPGHAPRTSLHRRLLAAIGIAASAAVLEIFGSWISGSLALLSDAGHVGTDAFALALSYGALRVSERPHTPSLSFGYHRTEGLAALLNGVLLVGVASFLLAQAYARSQDPPDVAGTPMFLLGLAGLAANLVMLLLLRGWARTNINARGAFLHAYGDTLGSAGVVAAAALIQTTGMVVFDLVVAVFIVGLILFGAGRLVRDGIRILLEASPVEVRPHDVAAAIQEVPGVRGVHDLHIWTVTSGLHALTGHITVDGGATVADSAAIVDRVRARLRERFGIAHATLQVDSFQGELIPSSEVVRGRT